MTPTDDVAQPRMPPLKAPDLIAMKTAAGRDQDLIDIDTLERSRRPRSG
jgi:hypothetical protein